MYRASAFIGGEAIFRDNEIKIFSPINGDVVGTIPLLEEKDIIQAFDSAREAFNKWKEVDLSTKTKYLIAFAAKLRENAGVLSQILHLETGKTLESAHSEIIRSAEYIVESVHAYSDLMEKPEFYDQANNILVPENIVGTYLRVPHGVVLSISPFNYPVNLMITKIVPAILCGNAVVHKSATNGSLSGWFISKLFHETSVDGFLFTPGVFNYVTGKGSEIGKWLIQPQKIDAFSFTGGTDTGKSIAKNFSFIPIQLELGGHNAAVVLEDADLNLAVNEICKGAFTFSGQRCTSIKKVLVSKKIEQSFLQTLKEKLNQLDLKEPLINSYAVDSVRSLYEDSINKGATLVSKELTIKDLYVSPVVFSSISKDMDIYSKEIFGPVLGILSFDKDEEVVELVNDSKYGLQASIFSKDIDRSTKVALKLEVGRININSSPARSPDILPFSGIKDSGFEVQGIKNSLYFFTRFKGIVLKKS